MKVMKVFNKFMKPFLKEYGFKYEGKRGGDELMFYHKEHKEALIIYSFTTIIKPCDVKTEVYGGIYTNPDIDLFLTDLLNGPDKVAQVFNTGDWYFDTEEELLGILEYQAGLFKKWVFDWMLGKKYTEIDVYKIKDLLFKKEGRLFDNANKEEQSKLLAEGHKLHAEWKTKRFYPVNWKL